MIKNNKYNIKHLVVCGSMKWAACTRPFRTVRRVYYNCIRIYSARAIVLNSSVLAVNRKTKKNQITCLYLIHLSHLLNLQFK